MLIRTMKAFATTAVTVEKVMAMDIATEMEMGEATVMAAVAETETSDNPVNCIKRQRQLFRSSLCRKFQTDILFYNRVFSNRSPFSISTGIKFNIRETSNFFKRHIRY
jgi:hypothetical protein